MNFTLQAQILPGHVYYGNQYEILDHLTNIMANAFLKSNPPSIGPHEENCFCLECRMTRVNRILTSQDVTPEMLHRVFFTQLTSSRETIQDQKFLHTMEEITIGYAYKRKCLDDSGSPVLDAG